MGTLSANAKYPSMKDHEMKGRIARLKAAICHNKRMNNYSTFTTPFGRYCFLKLPDGIISVFELFHKALEYTTEGLDATQACVDDITVQTSTIQEH